MLPKFFLNFGELEEHKVLLYLELVLLWDKNMDALSEVCVMKIKDNLGK